MEFLFEYGMFLAKAITLAVSIIVIVALVLGLASKQKQDDGDLSFESISEKIEGLKRHADRMFLSKNELKKRAKERKKQSKSEKDDDKAKLFVIDFVGSPMAKEVENLRREITAVLCVAKENDSVLVNVDSGGGVVHGYGLAASQLQRIKDANLHLTVSIDKVAASGGYLMAAVADKILCAPFAIVGSIGVIAQMPNFNKFMKKNDIDFEMHTAGDFKRTLTMLGENTDEAREKFKQDLVEIHELFKGHVKHYRENIDLEKVATGEYWLGTKALELGLVDELQTSDDFLLASYDAFTLYRVKHNERKNMAQKLGLAASAVVESSLEKIMSLSQNSTFR